MALRLHDQPEYPVTDLLRVYLEHSHAAPPPPPMGMAVAVIDVDDLWDRLGDFA